MDPKKKLDEAAFENLLYLSRLSPDSSSPDTLSREVGEIIGYFEILRKYAGEEDSSVPELSTETDALRSDDVVPGLDRRDLENLTPGFSGGYFRVPKVL